MSVVDIAIAVLIAMLGLGGVLLALARTEVRWQTQGAKLITLFLALLAVALLVPVLLRTGPRSFVVAILLLSTLGLAGAGLVRGPTAGRSLNLVVLLGVTAMLIVALALGAAKI